MARSAKLQELLDALEAAIETKCPAGDAHESTQRIFSSLRAATGAFATADDDPPLDSLTHLPAALENAERGPTHVAKLAGKFSALTPSLCWKRRAGSDVDPAFHNGHASTAIVGPLGIEVRSDVIIGAGLVAPNVAYPYHSHPPEELYSVMSDSQWFHEEKGWYRPGIGNVVFHTPNVQHAMRADDTPLLAIWALYTGANPP